jgi:hypothetical protein
MEYGRVGGAADAAAGGAEEVVEASLEDKGEEYVGDEVVGALGGVRWRFGFDFASWIEPSPVFCSVCVLVDRKSSERTLLPDGCLLLSVELVQCCDVSSCR